MSRLTLTLTLALVVANVCATHSAPVTYDQQQTGDLNVQVDLKDIQIVALLDSSYLGDYGDYDYAYDYSDFTIKPITPHASTARPSPSTASTTSVEPWHSWPTISGPPSSSTAPDIGEAQNATVTVKSTTQSSVATENKTETGDEKSQKVSVPSESTTAASSSVETPEVSLKLKATILESESITGDDDDVRLTEEQDKKVEKEDEIVATTVSDQLQESVSSTAANPSSIESGLPETTQHTRKCTSGYTRDQKGRCRRTQIRRRVPSSLLPFGIRLAPRVHRHRDQHSKTDSA